MDEFSMTSSESVTWIMVFKSFVSLSLITLVIVHLIVLNGARRRHLIGIAPVSTVTLLLGIFVFMANRFFFPYSASAVITNLRTPLSFAALILFVVSIVLPAVFIRLRITKP